MLQSDASYSENLDEFLKKITMWYETDHRGFRTLYDAAVENVVPFPDDTPEEVRCDWKNSRLHEPARYADGRVGAAGPGTHPEVDRRARAEAHGRI
ncbi:phosphatidylserine decarboxylase [Streptomyces sp. NBRC 110611]|nr:phosphatidylserine decarboxylase [Streptomyces sp. NBRC 110611]